MGLQAIGAVQGIGRHIVDARERVVRQRRDHLCQWQQAGGMSAALVVRAMRGNPLGDDLELLLVERQPVGAGLRFCSFRARRSARKRR